MEVFSIVRLNHIEEGWLFSIEYLTTLQYTIFIPLIITKA